jgi:oligopeptidase A
MTDLTKNPLVSLRRPIPFDQIRPEHVLPGIRELLAQAAARMAAIVEAPGPRTYANTLGALDTMTEALDDAMSVVSHLESVATSPELREVFNAVQPEVSAFYSGIPLSSGLWAALRAFAATPDAAALTGARRRLLEKTMADFRRHGADLPEEGKRRMSELDVELAQITLRYSQNVLDATNAFSLVLDDAARLSGLPEGAIEAAKASAEAAGKQGYRFTLQAPSYIPAMTYLDDAEVRKQLYLAFNTRATEGALDNRPIIRRIIELRREKATLLGFAHFADLVLDDRMAKRGKTARDFVGTLRAKTEAAFARENAELAAYRRELEGPSAPALAPWDVGYYAEKQRRARYDFDEEELRPYFAAERVLAGLFDVATRLYGLKIEPWEGAPVWHESVRPYWLRDESGRELGGFYVDIFPREEKRDGRPDGLEVLAANLTPPTAGKPALLTHREVETLFHEFGHMLHHALSQVEVRSLAGTNVAWDFVELPSQIMENWCWEREALDMFARHHESGEAIPEELLAKMHRARTFRAANHQMRQLGFAEVDLALHMDFDPASGGDPVAFALPIMAAHAAAPLPEGYAMVASFTHLFASPVGYASGYYSYKWAEVLDADAFSRFKQEGLFRREVGEDFRREILSRGDSDDPAELFRRFMGREPRLEALLERLALLDVGAEEAAGASVP